MTSPIDCLCSSCNYFNPCGSQIKDEHFKSASNSNWQLTEVNFTENSQKEFRSVQVPPRSPHASVFKSVYPLSSK